jgi:hypothetical protein
MATLDDPGFYAACHDLKRLVAELRERVDDLLCHQSLAGALSTWEQLHYLDQQLNGPLAEIGDRLLRAHDQEQDEADAAEAPR